jgi:bla regulator protein BlaR1
VIAHELSHIKRRDNLTAAIHMGVEAVFWFHPLVWWIGARLIEERERACDEAVLSLGGEPRDYADAIVSVCKLYVESPLTCVSGISGADLKKRIVRIMACHVGLRMNVGRKLLLGAAGLLAVAVPLAFGLMQEPSDQILHATGPLPSFEVATIKPNHSGPGPAFFGAAGHGAPLDRFIATNVSIRKLMGWAFAGDFLPLPDNEVLGGPSWIDSDRYDMEAKLENSQVVELRKLSDTDRMVQVRRMVQGLLADRFKLVVHDTTVTRPVYALVVAKGGPKLKENTPCVTESGATLPPLPPPPGAPRGSAPEPRGNFIGRPGDMMACQVSVKGLARSLELDPQFELDRPVVDQTGLTGNYTFDLKWTPDASPPGAVPGHRPAPRRSHPTLRALRSSPQFRNNSG